MCKRIGFAALMFAMSALFSLAFSVYDKLGGGEYLLQSITVGVAIIISKVFWWAFDQAFL